MQTRPPTKILLIEDDEDDYILLQKVLKKTPQGHYKLQWEHSYTSGLACMLTGEHDLCMLDYRLGAHTGIELLKTARSQGYNRPIILLTGANEGDIDILALQAGADDYIAKEQLQGELLHRIIRYAIERKKAEHERERLLSEQIAAQELERKRNEFIGMVVHELKTPLTSLKGYAQLLYKRCLKTGDEQTAQFASRMDGQITKLTSLVDDFLDVTRLAEGKLQFVEDSFSFDTLVEEVIQEIQLINEQQTIRREGLTNKTIWGDRTRTGQVITNLLTNAMKYAPDTDTILLKTSSDTDTVTLCVQDFGPGIPRALQNKIFDPFYRIEKNQPGTASGLGLGLHIAAEIIKRQGGRIWVESEEGKGATFWFTLPTNRTLPISSQEDAT
ncbi:MAG: response regulator [Ktedonobacteraceae bacterium]|nr:response regulator [Ktedonobacteraceae bacterium]